MESYLRARNFDECYCQVNISMMRTAWVFFFVAALIVAPARAKYRNVTVDNIDPSIHFTGQWSDCSKPDATSPPPVSYGNTRNCTRSSNTTASFTFTGVAIYYIAPLFSGYSPSVTTGLSLDSGPLALVNLSNQTSEPWAVRWGASGLNNGAHTIVSYGPISNASTTPTWGEVDAFIYTVIDQDPVNIAAIVGGAVGGAVGLASLGAGYIYSQHLADWLRHLAFIMFGWYLFKGRRLAFICDDDLPNTEIALFLSINQAQSGEDNAICWQVLKIGPGKPQEVVHVPARYGSGDPSLVICTLEQTEEGPYKAREVSDGPACEFIHANDACQLSKISVQNKAQISVQNTAMHPETFSLATTLEDTSANPFWKFTLSEHQLKDFTGSKIYIHAFRTVGVQRGSQHNFSDLDRITVKEGCEVSTLKPTTYWYVYKNGNNGLRVKIAESRKDIKRFKHELSISPEASG